MTEIAAIARRAGETPYDRTVRTLADMEANALANQMAAQVPPSPEVADAIRDQRKAALRKKAADEKAAKAEKALAAIRSKGPSWIDRMTGRHKQATAAATKRLDKAQANAAAAATDLKKWTNWVPIMEAAQQKRVTAAAPLAAIATHDLKLIQHARAMLTDIPRRVRLGPFAFIYEAAIRAGFKTRQHGSTDEAPEQLPTGDLRNRVNMWGLPID